MSQILQDQNGDLAIIDNKMHLVEDNDEIQQRLKQNLKTFLGEWFLDTTLGIPYFQLIFQTHTPISIIEDIFKDEILKTKGIVELLEFSLKKYDKKTRKLTIDFKVKTLNGSIALREDIYE
jgi:hypothetical protein